MRLTRRTFLFRTSAGAAALGAVVATPHLLGPQPTAGTAARPGAPTERTEVTAATRTISVPVMAYVRDASRGEIAVYVGTHEVVRHDPELVSRLLQGL